jgi:hypothetical protein
MKAAAAQPEPLPGTDLKMKKYMTAEDRAEEAATVRIANMVAHIAGLDLDTKIPILPSEFSQYLIGSNAQVLIVPDPVWNGDGRWKVEKAMRMAKCDAVMVHIIPGGSGSRSIMFTIARDGRVPVWFPEYSSRVVDGRLYFMPIADPAGPLFKLTNKGLMSSSDFDGIRFDGY